MYICAVDIDRDHPVFACCLCSVESRLRRSAGTAREPEDQLSNSGDDGSRPGDHHPSEVGQLWISAEHYAC